MTYVELVQRDLFQSTHPYGCDSICTKNSKNLEVSIHAPIRVRPLFCFCSFQESCFNPRTHTGATTNGATVTANTTFQSTHPYGCDGGPVFFENRGLSFNPRTHTGATWNRWGLMPGRMFQSTHPYGCDCTVANFNVAINVSIHAPIRVRLRRRI